MNELAEPTPLAFSNPLARYLAATRPAFLSATLVACLLGIAVACSHVPINASLALMTLVLALIAHSAVNVLNDYFDALNGSDALNTERLFPFTGGSRFIQNGVLTLQQTALFGGALMLAATLGGLWLAWLTTPGLMLIGAVGLFIGWAYSATPLRLNSRGLGELCVLAGFVGVVVGADYVQRQTFSLDALVAALPYGLLVTSLLYINQFPDYKADAAAGKRHWVVRLGPRRASLIYPLLLVMGATWLIMAVWQQALPVPALISLLPFGLSFGAAKILYRHCETPAALRPAIALTIAAMLVHGALLSAILFWEST